MIAEIETQVDKCLYCDQDVIVIFGGYPGGFLRSWHYPDLDSEIPCPGSQTPRGAPRLTRI